MRSVSHLRHPISTPCVCSLLRMIQCIRTIRRLTFESFSAWFRTTIPSSRFSVLSTAACHLYRTSRYHSWASSVCSKITSKLRESILKTLSSTFSAGLSRIQWWRHVFCFQRSTKRIIQFYFYFFRVLGLSGSFRILAPPTNVIMIYTNHLYTSEF